MPKNDVKEKVIHLKAQLAVLEQWLGQQETTEVPPAEELEQTLAAVQQAQEALADQVGATEWVKDQAHLEPAVIEPRQMAEALRESEARYRRLFEDSPIAIWEEDLSVIKTYLDRLRQEGVEDFRAYFDQHSEEVIYYATLAEIVNINQTTLEMYQAGNKAEFFEGIGQIFGPETVETFKEEMIAIAEGKTRFSGQSIHRTLSGTKLYVTLSWSVVPGFEDTFSRVVVSIVDVTNYKRAEDNLLRFKLGIERSEDAVFLTDVDGTIIYINSAFEKIYGYSRAEALGQTPRLIKSGLISQEAYQEFWQTLLAKQSVTGEIVNRAKDGRLITVAAGNNPILDEVGDLIGFLSIHRDVSEQKRAEEMLAKRAIELEAVAEVSTAASTILETDTLLQTVADLTRRRFGLYHAHIYLLNEAGDTLDLAVGAGDVGRQMVAEGWRIPLNREQSLVARAARTRQGVIVNDVRADPDFLPNPLLPDTRSEMAVPMIMGDQVLGVLDVQADTVNRFTEEDVRIQTTLAAQVAVALQNARQHERTRQRAAQLEWLTLIEASLSQATDEAEIMTAIALAIDLDQLTCSVSLEYIDTNENGQPTSAYTVAVWFDGMIQPDDSRLHQRYELRSVPTTKLWLESPNEVLFISDIHTGPQADENMRQCAAQSGIQAIAILPLYIGRHWQGILTFTWSEPHTFSPDERFYFEQLIEPAAAVVASRRAYLVQQETGRFLDSIVENIPTVLFVKDAEALRFVRFNRAGEELLGLDRENMIGKNDYDFFSPEQADLSVAQDREILAAGKLVDIPEEPVQTADGDTRLLHTRKVPILGADGKPKYLLAVSEDITERKQAEKELRHLGRVVEQSLDGMAIADLDGYVQFVNPAWARMHGYEVQELLGQPLSVFHTEEQLRHDLEPLNARVMTDGAQQGEVGHKRKDGSTFPTWMTVDLLRDAAGQPVGLIASAQDITERKQAQEMLAKRAKELSCLNDIGREIMESPEVPDFLQWVTERITPAMQYPEVCVAAIEFDGRIYGRREAVKLTYQMTNALRVGGKVMGHVYIAYREKHNFLDEESALLGGVARRISGYIENRRLLKQTEQALSEVADLYQASRTIADANKPEEVLRAIVNHVATTDVDRCSVLLNNAVTGQVDWLELAADWDRTSTPKGKGAPIGTRYPLEQFPLAEILSKDESFVVNDVATDERLGETEREVAIERLQARSLAIIPMATREHWLGIVLVTCRSPHTFTERELRLYQSLADQAATTIENQRLFEQTQTRVRHEQILRQITTRVRGSIDPDIIVRTAVRELGQALDRPTFVRLGSAEELRRRNGK